MSCDLVIFDWAGTLIDHGCRAPLIAFLEAFERCGLPIDEATARKPMGAHKRDHVIEILGDPDVAERARSSLGRVPDDAMVQHIYETFEERLFDVLPAFAEPIPGVVETLQELRRRGVALGGTTGYVRAMMDHVQPLAEVAGVRLDLVVCSDEVPQSRPAPWACFRIAERLGRYPLQTAVKVGDTPADMAEGQNAGMRAVGVSATGNEVGLDAASLAALSRDERAARVDAAAARLTAAGAEAVLSSVGDLCAWLDAPGQAARARS